MGGKPQLKDPALRSLIFDDAADVNHKRVEEVRKRKEKQSTAGVLITFRAEHEARA